MTFRGDPYVQRFDSEPLRNADGTLSFSEGLRAGQEAGQSISWAITLGVGEPAIGSVGLYQWNKHHSRAKLGYNQIALHRIEAATLADNHESVGLLVKLGFNLEGIRREYSWEGSPISG